MRWSGLLLDALFEIAAAPFSYRIVRDIAFVKDRAILSLFTSLSRHVASVAFCTARK
jgi:uncharacterized protein YdaL